MCNVENILNSNVKTLPLDFDHNLKIQLVDELIDAIGDLYATDSVDFDPSLSNALQFVHTNMDEALLIYFIKTMARKRKVIWAYNSYFKTHINPIFIKYLTMVE